MSGFRIAANASSFAPTPKVKSLKSRDYLSFIHELPCCVTGVHTVEAAHLSTADTRYGHHGRAKGTKAGDRWALPLSPEQHRRQHAGNEMAYWKSVGIDPHFLALVLWGLWSELGDSAAPFAIAVINRNLAEAGRLPSRDLA